MLTPTIFEAPKQVYASETPLSTANESNLRMGRASSQQVIYNNLRSFNNTRSGSQATIKTP